VDEERPDGTYCASLDDQSADGEGGGEVAAASGCGAMLPTVTLP